MKSTLGQLSLVSFALALSTGSATAAPAKKAAIRIPIDSVIEKVSFEKASLLDQALVLGRINVEPGEVLTQERAQQIARSFRLLAPQHGFSYKAGSKPGLVVLLISAATGC